MAPDVLVHLIEPAAWRAALTDGAVRPPSLESAGFVHLSTPEQVHLPAQRLYPGRRDMVLLVVDPARLTDPVRFEPGCPPTRRHAVPAPLRAAAGDRGDRRRPVPAAGAVRAARARTTGSAGRWRTRVGCRSAGPWASATCRAAWPCSTPTTPTPTTTTGCSSPTPVDADTVDGAAEEVGGNAGWPHRAAALLWPGRRGRWPPSSAAGGGTPRNCC